MLLLVLGEQDVCIWYIVHHPSNLSAQKQPLPQQAQIHDHSIPDIGTAMTCRSAMGSAIVPVVHAACVCRMCMCSKRPFYILPRLPPCVAECGNYYPLAPQSSILDASIYIKPTRLSVRLHCMVMCYIVLRGACYTIY